MSADLAQLITEMKESLEREIHLFRDEVIVGFTEVNTRFDTQAARLERQGSLIQNGSRWTARMNEWAEKIDGALETKDREIADLRQRLDYLEKRMRGNS